MAAPRQDQPGQGGQKGPGRKKGVHTINVTLPSLISASIVAVIGFGWVFVLGVIVGRGYNPEERLGLDRIMPRPAKNASHPPPMPEGVIKPEDLQFINSLRARPAPVSGNAGVAVDAPEIVPRAGGRDPQAGRKTAKAGVKKDGGTSDKADARANARAESRTAPAGKPDSGTGARRDDKKAAAPAGALVSGAATATSADGERFDYVYQVAAYKTAAPANALKAKLAASGIKSRVESSVENGVSWYRLNALFRGTPKDTHRLRAALADHGIHAVILRGKTPVAR